jgi:hypothetical protein
VLPSAIHADANMYGGRLDVNMQLDPLAEEPAFDLNAELKNTELVQLNDFFKAYGKFDVNKGEFGLYVEIATRDGDFKGYVKPVINDLDIVGHEDRHDNGAAKALGGRRRRGRTGVHQHPKGPGGHQGGDERQTQGPPCERMVCGDRLLRNAFIRAIQPSIDQEINIASVGKGVDEREGLFKKLFGSKEEKQKRKEENEEKEEKEKEEKKKEEKKE